MARGFNCIIGKKTVLLVFMCSVVKVENMTTLCPSHLTIQQLPSISKEENARGVKRSIATDITSTSTAPANRHETQDPDPPLTKQGSTDDSQGQSTSGRWSHPVDPILKNQEALDEVSTASGGDQAGKKHEKEGGQKHQQRPHNGDGETREKGYKKAYELAKVGKGHHEKGQQKGKDKNEKKTKHPKGQHRFGKNKMGKKRKKKNKYDDDEGHHKKGHRTQGEHNVHKKNEYHKKHEFYDEHHEGDDHGKHGAKQRPHKKSGEKKYKKGGHNSKVKKAEKADKRAKRRDKTQNNVVAYKKKKAANYGHKKKNGKKIPVSKEEERKNSTENKITLKI